MVEHTQNEDMLVFNLDHDLLVKFRDDASCTIEAFAQDTAPLRLSRDQQLLLLDRLCRTFAFPSPVASMVKHVEVGPAPDQDDERYTITPSPELDLPPLPPEGPFA